MFGHILTSFMARRRGHTVLAAAASVSLIAALALAIAGAIAPVAHGSGSGCISPTPSCTIRGQVANASFDSFDSTGTIVTSAFVSPFASLSIPGRQATQTIFVFVGHFNTSTGTMIDGASNFNLSTGLPDFTGTAQFGSNLASATVNGTAQMYDVNTGAPLFISTVNVSWSGFGPTSTFIDSSHQRGFGLLINSHFRGSSRAATAAGTITDATGANAAIGTTFNADLENSTNGTVQLSHS